MPRIVDFPRHPQGQLEGLPIDLLVVLQHQNFEARQKGQQELPNHLLQVKARPNHSFLFGR